jgi:hypothetical protein
MLLISQLNGPFVIDVLQKRIEFFCRAPAARLLRQKHPLLLRYGRKRLGFFGQRGSSRLSGLTKTLNRLP